MVIYFMNKWHSLKTYCPTMMYVDDVILIYFFIHVVQMKVTDFTQKKHHHPTSHFDLLN